MEAKKSLPKKKKKTLPVTEGPDANDSKKRKLLKKKKRKPQQDERFDSALNEPRFDTLANKDRKVVIDKRFKGMLSSEKFGTKCTVDMRGRRLNLGKKNNLGELYVQEEESSGDEDEERDIKIDLARGDGNMSSSDEDSGEDWQFEEEGEEDVEHGWGELDKEASRVESATRRLALCNMEWDRITANDIFVVLSSFKPPPPAAIKSVTIYLSDIGKERLEEEERSGPRIPNLAESIDDAGELDKKTGEAVRAYELEKLRYYYAIIECDGAQTAAAIYDQCDGVEFETSALRMDLRFVPEEMNFETNIVKERVTEEELDVSAFKPKFFESAALSKSSTKLTWDETDPERIQAQRDAFRPDADLSRLEHLIAPGSSDEEAEDGQTTKMGRLMSHGSDAEDGEEEDGMRVSWETGEKQTEEETLEMDRKKESAEPTPWQKYLQKRKQKRKERKAQIAALKKNQKAERETADTVPKEVASRRKKAAVDEETREQMDTAIADDNRFAALYTDSAFAIDQSHPSFKSSKLVEKQVAEKKKRKKVETEDEKMTSLADKVKQRAEKLSTKKRKRVV